MSIFHMATYPMLALFLLGDRRKHVLLAQGARKCGIDTQEPATDSASALPKLYRKSSLLLVSRLQTYSNHSTPVLLDQHRPVYTNDFEVGRAPIPELEKGISKVTFNEVRSVLCPPALC